MDTKRIIQTVGLIGFVMLIFTGVTEAATATLSYTDVVSTSAANINLCSILFTVRDFLLLIIPVLAVFMIGITGVLWLISGSREDFLTLSKNIAVKTAIGMGFSILFYLILDLLATIIPHQDAKDILTKGGQVSQSGVITEQCNFVIWQNTHFDNFSAQTFLTLSKTDTLYGMLIDLSLFGTAMVGLLAIIFILFGGIQYILATGPDGATKARNTIMYASAGVILAWLSSIIIRLVFSFF